MKSTTYLIFTFCLALSICKGSDLYTNIYHTLDAAPCVLLLDKNGPVGCTAPEDGSVGDLHVLHTQEALDAFIASPPGDSKAIAMPAALFNKLATTKLHATNKVKGVLLINSPPPTAGWSPDNPYPNEEWGLKSAVSDWNPPGDGLNFVKIPFPVYALSKQESLNILTLATNDTSYPRRAVKFSTFMHATMDAKTCLRRGQCIPLGGKSVWSSFDTIGTKPIIMAMANIDSTAIFHDLAVGADSTVSGIVGLLGAALALQEVDRSAFVNDIIFAFWAGESWGYLGSKKFCEELGTSSNTCKRPYKSDLSFQSIHLENISAIFELNQIGLSNNANPKLYMHQQANGASDPLTDLLQAATQGVGLDLSVASEIPPSSLMSFLNHRPNLPSVVITDHEREYANRNYHSHLDNGIYNPLSNATICAAATTLARTLYLLATNQQQPNVNSSLIQAPCSLLEELTVCLTSNFSCSLLNHFLDSPRVTTPTYYTGVFGYSIDAQYVSSPAVFLNNMLSLITAQNLFFNFSTFQSSLPVVDECKKCLDDQLCVQGICVNSETHYHDALSLGFDWDYKNGNWKIVNESEPLWVESDWDSLGVEIFQRENPTTEALFLTFGIIEFLISLVAVFYAKRYFLRNFKIF